MSLRMIAVIGMGLGAGSMVAAEVTELKDEKAKLSYGIGMNTGNSLKRQNYEVDTDILLQGLKDALAGKPTLITEKEAREVMLAYSKELRAKQDEKKRIAGEMNKKEGEDFLAANARKEGIKTTASGLQYKVITEGNGPMPKATDTVTTHYRGTLIDGTEFDNSYKRVEPTSFAVNGVVPGWTEALQMMKVGSKWQLFIPSNLAYKERGYGRDIGPNVTLIFELELLGIKAPASTAAFVQPNQPVTSDIIKVPSAEELKKGAKIEVIKADQVEKEAQKQNTKKP